MLTGKEIIGNCNHEPNVKLCRKCVERNELVVLRAELARLRGLCGQVADRLEDMDTAWTIAWYNMTNEQKRKTLRQCDTVGLPNGFVLQAIFAGNKAKVEAAGKEKA